MKITVEDNTIVLEQVYNSIVLRTKEGKELCICMRDFGFEVKIDNGAWHLISGEGDFVIHPKLTVYNPQTTRMPTSLNP